MKLTDSELALLIVMVENELYETQNESQIKVLITVKEKLADIRKEKIWLES